MITSLTSKLTKVQYKKSIALMSNADILLKIIISEERKRGVNGTLL